MLSEGVPSSLKSTRRRTDKYFDEVLVGSSRASPDYEGSWHK
jgi:hypothetical protein